MRKLFLPIVLVALSLFTFSLAKAFISSAKKAQSKTGGYQVLTKGPGGWVVRGTVNFGLKFDEKALNIGRYLPDADGEYKIRITHSNHGMANLDFVALKSDAKIFTPDLFFDTADKTDFLKKLSVRDLDVINAHGKIFEAHFTAPKGISHESLELKIAGREEDLSQIKGGVPCPYPAFPSSNGERSSYTYKLGQNRGALKLDGLITPKDHLGRPLFQSFTKPISGHPDGFTYGYLKNDDHYLYGVIDYTSDNTFDGLEDFSALLIKTKNGWKRFQVSVGQEKWGRHGFTYTDKVPYQHKVYEFKIPLEEIEVKKQNGEEIQVAFLAYGTSACPTTVTISVGGQNTDPGTQQLGDANIEVMMLQIDFFNNELAVLIDTITVTGEGTGDEASDVASVKFYNDVNNDGALDAGDTLLATSTFAADNGTVNLDLTDNGFTSAGSEKNGLVIYEINTSAASASTYKAKIASNNDFSTEADSPCPPANVTYTGAPIEGSFLTVSYGAGTAAAGASNPADSEATTGNTNVPAVQLSVTANSTEALNFTSVTVTGSGSGNESSDIEAVRFWEDADGSGTVTDGDTELAEAGTFAENDGTVTLTLNTASQIAASASKDYLVTYDFTSGASASFFKILKKRLAKIDWQPHFWFPWALPLSLTGCGGGSGDSGAESSTFTASIANSSDIVLSGENSSRTINPSGLPVSGGAITLTAE